MQFRRAMLLLVSIQFIAMGAMEMASPFWPVHLKSISDAGVDTIVVFSSIVYVSSGLATMISAPFWGRLGDRVGHKKMILRSLFALFIGQLLFYFITNIGFIILVRIAQGIFSGFIMSAQSYAIARAFSVMRGKILSYLQSATACGSLAGPLAGGIIMDKYNFATICIISSGLCLLCFMLSLLLPELKSRVKTGETVAKVNYRWILAIAIIIVLVQAAKIMPQSFFSLYVTSEFGLSNFITGLIYSLSGVTLAVSAPVWANFFSRKEMKGKIRYIEIIIWFCTLTLVVTSVTSDWMVFMISRMLWGVWQGALLPVAYTLIIENCPGKNYGSYLAIGNSAAKAGAIFGVLLGGVMVSMIGIQYGFWCVVLFYAISGLLVRVIRKTQYKRG